MSEQVGAEAFYLEHFDENERRYRDWCSARYYDPEAVGSAVAYEQWWAERDEAMS
jgi:hypothetical protein